MEYLKIAEDFGKIVWPCKDRLKIEDIMLFGSVAYGKQNPSDLDLLVLHYSEKLDNFQDIADSKISDLNKLILLTHSFAGEINIQGFIQGTSIEKLISENKFNTKFMNVSFFNNLEYRKKWKEKDLKIHASEMPKARLHGETFEECIFRQGLLYNQETQKYDIPALQKYNLKSYLHPQKNLTY